MEFVNSVTPFEQHGLNKLTGIGCCDDDCKNRLLLNGQSVHVRHLTKKRIDDDGYTRKFSDIIKTVK